jgi:hypothetical protein
MALATALTNQGLAEAIYRFDRVMGYREFRQVILQNRWPVEGHPLATRGATTAPELVDC